MELQACLEGRRSIRRYKDIPVSRETLMTLIEAAQSAPSWKNLQTARYYIADGAHRQGLLDCLASFNQGSAQNAAALIVAAVVHGQSGFLADGTPQTHLGDGFQYFDSGLQTENLCLKAHSLGLGTLIMGVYDEAAVRAYFGIGDDQKIVCIIAVGVPDIAPAMPPRLQTAEIVTFKD